MAEPALDIEWIVREVVRRIAAQAEGKPAKSESVKPAGQANHELRVPGRVVSLARLDGKLAGVQRIVVEAGAIVTPAVRDELRTRQIAIGEAKAEKHSSGQSLTCGIADTRFEPSALLRTLAGDGTKIETLARTGMLTVVHELVEQVVRGGSLGLLLTGQPALALCVANRNASVRAAQAGCLSSLKDAIESVGVNFLVLNPAGKSSFELGRIVNLFVQQGGRCPAALEPNR